MFEFYDVHIFLLCMHASWVFDHDQLKTWGVASQTYSDDHNQQQSWEVRRWSEHVIWMAVSQGSFLGGEAGRN